MSRMCTLLLCTLLLRSGASGFAMAAAQLTKWLARKRHQSQVPRRIHPRLSCHTSRYLPLLTLREHARPLSTAANAALRLFINLCTHLPVPSSLFRSTVKSLYPCRTSTFYNNSETCFISGSITYTVPLFFYNSHFMCFDYFYYIF